VDIDGEPWANPPAMGADQPGLTTGPLNLGIDAGCTNVATGYATWFGSSFEGPVSRSVWDFGDGTVLTNQPFTRHAWSVPGSYIVRLTGFNDSHPEGVIASATVTVRDAVYYVDAAGSNPVSPFATWQTAATRVQDAVDAAVASGTGGATVLLTNGVYRAGSAITMRLGAWGVVFEDTNRVVLSNEVRLQSVNGPEVTVIDGGGEVRCAWVGDGSVLNGLAMTGGYAQEGGGLWCEPRGVAVNCVLTNNSARNYGGGYPGREAGRLPTRAKSGDIRRRGLWRMASRLRRH
jgi:hypothetical protein